MSPTTTGSFSATKIVFFCAECLLRPRDFANFSHLFASWPALRASDTYLGDTWRFEEYERSYKR
jgi:hypothetical protein